MENPPLCFGAPDALPQFDRLRPEDATPAIDRILAENRVHLAALLADSSAVPSSWETLIEPLDDMNERLARAWGPVTHLFAVRSTPAWRAAFNACLPKITDYQLDISLNEQLFRAYGQLAASAGFVNLSHARKKVVLDALRDFRLSGVALPAARKKRFKAISIRLSDLQSKFEENVLDATQSWSRHVPDGEMLRGMTEHGLMHAAAKANARNLEGYLLTLDFPGFDAVISHAHERHLREEVYKAFATRASDLGPSAGRFDNTPLMEEILRLRHNQAQMLGFANYAELALETRMAQSPTVVEQFLLNLADHARPRALQELRELERIAKLDGAIQDLMPWDTSYFAEKLREENFGLSDEILLPYFPLPNVLEGMYRLAESLFHVKIEPVYGVPTWHDDVTTFALKEIGGADLGFFFLDLYARDDKRGGAWMDECRGRRRSRSGLQRPVAYLTCNFAPPLPGQPALLAHDDVVTLFHEFGHSLQHLLTQVDEAEVAGIRGVPWDAVELPSQFMENWCYHRDTLKRFARHWQSNAPLPDTLVKRLNEHRQFGAGMAMLRQVELALFDLRLHTSGANPDIYGLLEEVRREISIIRRPEWDRFPCSFGHIFAGGYAAGYYSYKWAEVLSADAFSAFEEAGFAQAVGKRFRDTILGEGGARDAMDIFRDFRGREPSIEPLLRQAGLLNETGSTSA